VVNTALASGTSAVPSRLGSPGALPDAELDARTSLPCSLRARQLWGVRATSRAERLRDGCASLVSGTVGGAKTSRFAWSSSGCRLGRSGIAALFAARKAAVGRASDVACGSALGDEYFAGVRGCRWCQGVRASPGTPPDADLDARASLPCSLRARQLWGERDVVAKRERPG